MKKCILSSWFMISHPTKVLLKIFTILYEILLAFCQAWYELHFIFPVLSNYIISCNNYIRKLTLMVNKSINLNHFLINSFSPSIHTVCIPMKAKHTIQICYFALGLKHKELVSLRSRLNIEGQNLPHQPVRFYWQNTMMGSPHRGSKTFPYFYEWAWILNS